MNLSQNSESLNAQLDETHLYSTLESADFSKKLVVLVGLPARGKTYTSKRLTRYLTWIGLKTRLFNVGDYRRKCQPSNYESHEFFNSHNEKALQIRNQACELALRDAFGWLKDLSSSIAILDATNSTRLRRAKILNECETHGVKVLFIEMICTDDEFVKKSILEVKVTNPDYVNMKKEIAVNDFLNRIQHYKEIYEPISESHDANLSYVKMINRGEQLILNKISDNISSRICYFLMNLRELKRTIYITRHGESMHNVCGKIGGNSELSEQGKLYAEKLGEYFNALKLEDLVVWTSLLKRTQQTAKHINSKKTQSWRILNEIDAGHFDSMTYEEIQKKFPEEFDRRRHNKYFYRYPMGESYHDLINRIEPIMMALGNEKNVLIVCHRAVARCIIGYFLDYSRYDIPHLDVHLHEVTKLTPTAYGCDSEQIKFDVSRTT